VYTYKVNNYPTSYQEVPGSLLEYQLEQLEKALGFQVTHQSPAITNFLSRNKFQASNGLTVDISAYPEYKESNLTIYLQGSDKMKNGKTDVTNFYSNKVASYRKAMIEQALIELVAAVKKVSRIQNQWSFPQVNVRREYMCFPSYKFGF